MNSFLSGAMMMGCWVASMFFLRFWRASSERLFLIFSISFGMMAVERVILELTDPLDEFRPYVYLIRLSAFLFLIAGIVMKNSSQDDVGGGTKDRSHAGDPAIGVR